MRVSDSASGSKSEPRIRRDGWTPERQLRFLEKLAETRSVSAAAASAGMSRESAYRLRARKEGLLFGHLWDRIVIVQPDTRRSLEAHTAGLSDGRLLRLLGNHFRRKSGAFLAIGSTAAKSLGR